MAEIIATENPAPAYASALRTAWPKSANDRCMRDDPSLIRNRTVGLTDRGRFDTIVALPEARRLNAPAPLIEP